MLAINISQETEQPKWNFYARMHLPRTLADLKVDDSNADLFTLDKIPNRGVIPAFHSPEYIETYGNAVCDILCGLHNTTLYHYGQVPPRVSTNNMVSERYAINAGNRYYGYRGSPIKEVLTLIGGLRALISLLEAICGTDELGRTTVKTILSRLSQLSANTLYSMTQYSHTNYNTTSNYDFEHWYYNDLIQTIRTTCRLPGLDAKAYLRCFQFPNAEYVPRNSALVTLEYRTILCFLNMYQELYQGFPDLTHFQLRVGKTPVRTLNRITAETAMEIGNVYRWGRVPNTAFIVDQEVPPKPDTPHIYTQRYKPSPNEFLTAPNYTGLLIAKNILSTVMITPKQKTVEFLLSYLFNLVLENNVDAANKTAAVFMVRVNDLKLELDAAWGETGRHAFCRHINAALKPKLANEAQQALAIGAVHNDQEHSISHSIAISNDNNIPFIIRLLDANAAITPEDAVRARQTTDTYNKEELYAVLKEGNVHPNIFSGYGLNPGSGNIGLGRGDDFWAALDALLPSLYDSYVAAYENQGYAKFLAGEPFRLYNWWL